MEEIAENIGMYLENKIREKILSNVPPENAPSTIKAKGSSHTLIDDGILLASISHIVENTDNGFNITSGVLDEDIAERAAPNEHGVAWENRPVKGKEEKSHGPWFIPPRSFIRSTYDEEEEIILQTIQEELKKYAYDKLSKQ